MLVGLIPPTAGDALVPLIEGKYGLDNENSSAQPHVHRSILTDMQSVRSTLGVCPQHDILFTELTVTQHLEIYAAFKGVPSNQVSAQATKMIAEVGLVEKANARAGTLSGGQKRKLSLGIALIGDSKVRITSSIPYQQSSHISSCYFTGCCIGRANVR